MMTKNARFVGLIVGGLLLGSGVVNAATITLVGELGLTAQQVTSQLIAGGVSGTTALSFANDWVGFQVAPTTNTTVTVNALAGGYTNAQYEVTANSINSITSASVVVGPTAADNTALFQLLSAGTYYFLQLVSGTPTDGFGQSTYSLKVALSDGGNGGTTPLPGALVLFGTVLAGAGAFMRRRRDNGLALPV